MFFYWCKVVDADEHPRPVSAEKMAALRPVFKKDGVVTAANASGICDGAGRQVRMFGDGIFYTQSAQSKLRTMFEAVMPLACCVHGRR